MPVVLGLLMGDIGFGAPCHFLVLLVRPFCGWPGCSRVNQECIKSGCLWLGVDAGLSIM